MVEEQQSPKLEISRRTLVGGIAVCAGATAAGVSSALAQASGEVAPPTTITSPPRDFSRRGAPTTYFWDPDVIAVDPSFESLAQPNTSILRLHTGLLWAEGPAWSAQGRYLLWSDIPNNRQMRWSEDDGHVSVFRSPSNHSNGNSFDFQGRQLSCEHLTRRVVRYEHDGTATVLAESYNGKRLNSPNDVVAHPDGSYWFTDPPYGGQLYEGEPDAAGGASNAAGKLNPRIGQPAGFVPGKRELPTNCYRVDPSGRIDLVVSEDQVPDPNGLAFSPDYKKLYVISTGKGPGDTGAGGKGEQRVRGGGVAVDGDVVEAPVYCGINGNVWVSSNAGRHVGYSGVTVWSPSGQLLGRIRLPEVCGNLCFGGPKRNRLFMAASQSLYAVYLATQGAAPG